MTFGGITRCPRCLTSGPVHLPDGDECREAAEERSISQSDDGDDYGEED